MANARILALALLRTAPIAALVGGVLAAGPCRADAVTDWNQTALNATHVTAAFAGGAIYQVRAALISINQSYTFPYGFS